MAFNGRAFCPGATFWRYDAGEDVPSIVRRQGYFRSLDVAVDDLILANCGGARLLLIVVKGPPSVEVGLLCRWPAGLAPGRKS